MGLGLNFLNRTKSAVVKIANVVKKDGSKVSGEAVQAIKKGGEKQILSSLDALAANAKAGIAKVNNIEAKEALSKALTLPQQAAKSARSVSEHFHAPDVATLARESVIKGSNAQEAVNGAKAAISAIGAPSGKSARQSAQVFTEFGKTASEKALDLAERKAELAEKYGGRLAAKKASADLANELKKIREYL